MKIKHGFISTALIGIAAGVVRILQYKMTIGADGYYIGGHLSDLLRGILVGLFASGAIWSIICGLMQKKSQAVLPHHFTRSAAARILFLLLAPAALADGLYRLSTSADTLSLVLGVLCIASALTWLLLGIRGKQTPVLAILPVLQLGAMIIDYFWHTYKFIQVSEYTLGILGLCALVYFALLLTKAMIGADCSKQRLAIGSFMLMIFGAATLMAPLAGGFRIPLLLTAIQCFLYCLLAALMLIWLPEKSEPAPKAEGPDLEALNEYISELPEVEEDDENEL